MSEEKTKAKKYFRPREELVIKRSKRIKFNEPPVNGAQYEFMNGQFVLVRPPKKKTLNEPPVIRPGEYRSFDGNKIKVWFINQDSEDFPVVGAIRVNNVWEPRVWNMEGVTKIPYGNNNDIVAEWSEG
jgi:hypothetical protein